MAAHLADKVVRHGAAPCDLAVTPRLPLLITQQHLHRTPLVRIRPPQTMARIRPRRVQNRIPPRPRNHHRLHRIARILIAPHLTIGRQPVEPIPHPVIRPIIEERHRRELAPRMSLLKHLHIRRHHVCVQPGPHLRPAVHTHPAQLHPFTLNRPRNHRYTLAHHNSLSSSCSPSRFSRSPFTSHQISIHPLQLSMASSLSSFHCP